MDDLEKQKTSVPLCLAQEPGSKAPDLPPEPFIADTTIRGTARCQSQLPGVYTQQLSWRSFLLCQEMSFVFPGRATKSYDEMIIVIINPFHQES